MPRSPVVILRELPFIGVLLYFVCQAVLEKDVVLKGVHASVCVWMVLKLLTHFSSIGPLAGEEQRVRDFFNPPPAKKTHPEREYYLCIGTHLNNPNAHYQKFLIKEAVDVESFVDTYRDMKISFSVIYCIRVYRQGSLEMQVKNHLHNRHSSVSNAYLASTSEIEKCLIESGCVKQPNGSWVCKEMKQVVTQLQKLKDEEENDEVSEVIPTLRK